MGQPASSFYQLSIGKCIDGKYPIEVYLIENDATLDSLALDWSAPSDSASKVSLKKMSGIGDPLADLGSAWAIGSAENGVVTAVRPVRLSPERFGLLVDQIAGFEQVKRRHYLFIADGQKLKRVWTGTEGEGPHWSTVVIAQSTDGASEDLIYFSGFRFPDGVQPDTLEVTRHSWNPKENQLVERRADGLIYAAELGSYTSVAKARQVRVANGACVSDYWILPSGRFEERTAGKVVLAALTTRKLLAQETMKAAQACSPGSRASVGALRRSRAVESGGK